MANCTKCGAPLVEGAMFCPSCGQAVAQPFEMGAQTEQSPFEDQKYTAPQYEQPAYQDYAQTNYQEPQYQQSYNNYDPYGMQPYGNDRAMGIVSYITSSVSS